MANHKILIADRNSLTINMFSTVIQNIGLPWPIQATSGQLAIKEFVVSGQNFSFSPSLITAKSISRPSLSRI